MKNKLDAFRVCLMDEIQFLEKQKEKYPNKIKEFDFKIDALLFAIEQFDEEFYGDESKY